MIQFTYSTDCFCDERKGKLSWQSLGTEDHWTTPKQRRVWFSYKTLCLSCKEKLLSRRDGKGQTLLLKELVVWGKRPKSCLVFNWFQMLLREHKDCQCVSGGADWVGLWSVSCAAHNQRHLIKASRCCCSSHGAFLLPVWRNTVLISLECFSFSPFVCMCVLTLKI